MPCHDRSGRVEVQLHSFLNSVLDGVVGQRHDLAALPPGRNPSTYCVQDAESAPLPVQTGMEKRKSLSLTGFRTPNRSACSESLYLLRCSGPPKPRKFILLTTEMIVNEPVSSEIRNDYVNHSCQYIRLCVLTFRHRASSVQDRRFAALQRTPIIYLINKYISLSDICLTMHH